MLSYLAIVFALVSDGIYDIILVCGKCKAAGWRHDLFIFMLTFEIVSL